MAPLFQANYDRIGQNYAQFRRPDPQIAAAIASALGDACTVVNVGAGAGSYEPTDRLVLAVEPSVVMIEQRPPGAAPCIRATAESLPIPDAAFDASMATLTIHHWDWRSGLCELRRVSRKRIVVLTVDPSASSFWLTRDYFPAIEALDKTSLPSIEAVAAIVGASTVIPVLIPHDCTDGFLGAYWRRPQAYLDEGVRASISSFSRIDARAGLRKLEADLDSGHWRQLNAAILAQDSLDIGYRILLAELDGAA